MKGLPMVRHIVFAGAVACSVALTPSIVRAQTDTAARVAVDTDDNDDDSGKLGLLGLLGLAGLLGLRRPAPAVVHRDTDVRR